MNNQQKKLLSRVLFTFLLVPVLAVACRGGGSGGSGGSVPFTPTPTVTPTPTPIIGGGGGGQAYRVLGESNQVSFSGEICSLEKPFVIDGVFPGGTASTTFTPDNAAGGVTAMSGGGSGCTQSGEGTYTIVSNSDNSLTLQWTDTATLICPGINNNRTATFELPLIPAPEISCP